DNIPGLPGIGEKTATKLLEEFDTVENLLANVDKLKGKQQEIVRTHGEKAILSKWLATIDTNAPIHFKDENYEIESFDREALIEIFKELEFRSLADAILRHPLAGAPPGPPVRGGTASGEGSSRKAPVSNQGNLFGDEMMHETAIPAIPERGAEAANFGRATQNINTVEHTYHVADTSESRAELIAELEKAGAFCYDSETTSLDATQADLVGFSFAIKAHAAWYVPIPAHPAEAQQIVEEFRPLFENEKLEKIGQNLKYDAIVLKNYGVEVRGPLFDTMLAHYLLEPENRRHGLDFMAETMLDYAPVKIEDLIGKKGAAQGNMRDVPVEAIKEYAGEDADITLQLHDLLAPKLEAGGENLVKLFREVETPLVSVLAAIEHAGVRIDPDFLQEYSIELG
ncbi:MAG: DNA polymerase I, partial [Saprospiraceae bacterium]|nr:DNA polymerase I [Saprospiraceae bacterium]